MTEETLVLNRPLVMPKFANQEKTGLLNEIRRRVNLYFQNSGFPQRGGFEITFKTIFLFSLFVASYALMLSQVFPLLGTFFMALLFGLTNVLIVFNIAHDAAHNALFNHDRLNKILSYSFNLVGASAYMWNITHNQIHHAYPNIGDYDSDIQQTPLIRVSPTVSPRWYHRYQVWYATLVYMLYSIYLIFQRDYEDIRLFPNGKNKILAAKKHPVKEYVILMASKLFYYSFTIVIPFLVLDITWQQFLLGYMAVHICMSLLLIAVLLPVHMVDEAPFLVLPVDGTIEDSWAMHVFKNTVDFSAKSKWANWFFGGLNTHLVHHLFPGVTHVHYIALSDILRETSKEYEVKYWELTMGQAIASHYRLLKKMSK